MKIYHVNISIVVGKYINKIVEQEVSLSVGVATYINNVNGM